MFGVKSYVLILNLVIAFKLIYAVCDGISDRFQTGQVNDLRMTSQRRYGCLLFCLFSYLLTALPLFWKRFEVISYDHRYFFACSHVTYVMYAGIQWCAQKRDALIRNKSLFKKNLLTGDLYGTNTLEKISTKQNIADFLFRLAIFGEKLC